jgi:apolipoprotein N-acyltransferase
MKGTWQTTDSGGGLTVPLAIGAAVLAVAVAGPVAAAVTAVAQALVITIAALAAVAVLAGAALLVYRVRQGQRSAPLRVRLVPPVTRQAAQPLPAPQQPAIERPAEIHLHLHGVSADDIAAILRRPPE